MKTSSRTWSLQHYPGGGGLGVHVHGPLAEVDGIDFAGGGEVGGELLFSDVRRDESTDRTSLPLYT